MSTALPIAIAALIDAAADRHGIPREIARAVAWVESRGSETAKSSAGAMGVMQLMPDTAKGLGVADPWDAAQNIDGGVRYLRKLLDRFGLWKPALAAYNWGPGRVKAKPDEGQWPDQVQGYVSKVLTRAAVELQGIGPTPAEEADTVITKRDERTGRAAGPFVGPPRSRSLGPAPHCPSCSCVEAEPA